MEYREHRVLPPLDVFVECVWFLNAAAGDAAATPVQRILPDGCAELIVHLRDRFHAVSASGLARQPACFVVGVLTAPLVVAPAADVDTMGVRFRPGGAYPFVRAPLSALTDRAVALDDLWGSATTARVWDELAAVAGDGARIGVIARELQRRLAARADRDRLTPAAIAALVKSAGRARIGALADHTGTTTRQLQRRFADRVGVSPKVLARILRFQRTLLQRATDESARTDWVRIAVECGYADQSHLIHDYATFSGGAPSTLLQGEGELSAYFTAPPRLAAMFGLPSCKEPSPEKH